MKLFESLLPYGGPNSLPPTASDQNRLDHAFHFSMCRRACKPQIHWRREYKGTSRGSPKLWNVSSMSYFSSFWSPDETASQNLVYLFSNAPRPLLALRNDQANNVSTSPATTNHIPPPNVYGAQTLGSATTFISEPQTSQLPTPNRIPTVAEPEGDKQQFPTSESPLSPFTQFKSLGQRKGSTNPLTQFQPRISYFPIRTGVHTANPANPSIARHYTVQTGIQSHRNRFSQVASENARIWRWNHVNPRYSVPGKLSKVTCTAGKGAEMIADDVFFYL